jgi:hypothetical protein
MSNSICDSYCRHTRMILRISAKCILVISASSEMKTYHWGWLVVHDILNLLHDLVGQLGYQIQSLHINPNTYPRCTLTFMVTCSGLLAPVMTVETLGFFKHQAKAKAAVLPPTSFASSASFWIFAILALPTSVSNSSRNRFMNGSSFIARRESSGIPSLYLPDKSPPARGDQIVVP